MSSCATHLEATELITIDKNIGEVIFQYEVQKQIRRRGVAPSIFIRVFYEKPTEFGFLLKLSVVVGVASATILYSSFIVIVMNHFVK